MEFIWYYIKRLVKKDFRESIESTVRSLLKVLIRTEMLINNFEKLNDNFIDFNLTRIKKYFDDNAWKNVQYLHDSKKIHSKCSICDKFCLEMCVSCSSCKYWYHYDCIKLSTYYRNLFRNNPKAIWLCKKSKEYNLTCKF